MLDSSIAGSSSHFNGLTTTIYVFTTLECSEHPESARNGYLRELMLIGVERYLELMLIDVNW